MTTTPEVVSKRQALVESIRNNTRLIALVASQIDVCLGAMKVDGPQGEYSVQLSFPADLGTEDRNRVIERTVRLLIGDGISARNIGGETIALIWSE